MTVAKCRSPCRLELDDDFAINDKIAPVHVDGDTAVMNPNRYLTMAPDLLAIQLMGKRLAVDAH